jgi:hypothetical protein
MKVSHSATPTAVALALLVAAAGEAAAGALELVAALRLVSALLQARINRPITRQKIRRRDLDIFILPDQEWQSQRIIHQNTFSLPNVFTSEENTR